MRPRSSNGEFLELRLAEVLRILLPRTLVNKGTIIRTIAPRDRLFSLCRLVRYRAGAMRGVWSGNCRGAGVGYAGSWI
jgi:hypothetical protein